MISTIFSLAYGAYLYDVNDATLFTDLCVIGYTKFILNTGEFRQKVLYSYHYTVIVVAHYESTQIGTNKIQRPRNSNHY